MSPEEPTYRVIVYFSDGRASEYHHVRSYDLDSGGGMTRITTEVKGKQTIHFLNNSGVREYRIDVL